MSLNLSLLYQHFNNNEFDKLNTLLSFASPEEVAHAKKLAELYCQDEMSKAYAIVPTWMLFMFPCWVANRINSQQNVVTYRELSKFLAQAYEQRLRRLPLI